MPLGSLGLKPLTYGGCVVVQLTIPRLLACAVAVIDMRGQGEILRPYALTEGEMILSGASGGALTPLNALA